MKTIPKNLKDQLQRYIFNGQNPQRITHSGKLDLLLANMDTVTISE